MNDDKIKAARKLLPGLASLIERSDLTNLERRGVHAAWFALLDVADVQVVQPSGTNQQPSIRTIGFKP